MFPKTKKLLLSLLIPLALLLHGCGGDDADSTLEYVPADAVVYIGSQEPFPLKESMVWNHKTFPFPDSIYKDLQSEALESDTSGQKFIKQLFISYLKLVSNPEILDSEWGIAAENKLTFYTLGLAPVLRLNLSDPKLFKKKIAEIETSSGITSESNQLGEASYRRYLLGDDDKAKVWLIIGYDMNDVIITVDLGVDSENDLAIALGQKKPEKSLASTQQVDQLKEKYNFNHNALFGFINQKELINGLTSTDANRVSKMIHFFEQLSNEKGNELDELRTPACRSDMLAIADNWPRTVFGYNQFDFRADPVKLKMQFISEINDKTLLEGLKSINGFIPNFVTNDEPKVVSWGLGLDLDNLTPFFTQQLNEIKKKSYQCAFLKETQKSLKAVNPGMLAMATAMLQGVKGISMTLNKVEVGEISPQGMPDVKKLDTILTLSATNVKKLVLAAQALTPMLAQIEIPDDGSTFEIPMPMPISGNEKVMGFVKDSHMAVYIGDTASRQAEELSQTPLSSSSTLTSMQIDYGEYYGMIFNSLSASSAASQSPEVLEMMAMLKEVDLNFNTTMQITDDGLVFDTEMVAPQKN